MPTHLETVAQLRKLAISGALAEASTTELEAYAAALCHPNAFGEFGAIQFPQICETVRVHLLRAHIGNLQSHVIELHDHITALNKSNAKIQWWVIALAAAALIAAVVQTTVAIRGEWREEAKNTLAAQQQKQPSQQLSAPTPAKHPSNHPASSPEAGGKTVQRKPAS
jgi:hypothetical protein